MILQRLGILHHYLQIRLTLVDFKRLTKGSYPDLLSPRERDAMEKLLEMLFGVRSALCLKPVFMLVAIMCVLCERLLLSFMFN